MYSTEVYIVNHVLRDRTYFYPYAKFQMKLDEPGTPIGIIAIQEILRVSTQSNLSSFHQLGQGNESGYGHPTIRELLDIPTVQKSSSTILEDWSGEEIFPSTNLRDIIKGVGCNIGGIPESEWYETGQEIGLFSKTLNLISQEGSWMKAGEVPKEYVVRLFLDPYKLCQLKLFNLQIICDRLFSEFEYVYSPWFVGVIDVYVGDKAGMVECLGYLDRQVCGVSGINQVGKRDVDGRVTLGSSNIRGLSTLADFDISKLYSNNIRDVEKTLGLEATREVLRRELSQIYHGNSQYVNLVADFMTWSGKLSPMTKHNPHLMARGTLASMGFERAKDDIKKAVLNQSRDDLNSVYSRIMIGQGPSVGTGDTNFRIVSRKTRSSDLSQVSPQPEK